MALQVQLGSLSSPPLVAIAQVHSLESGLEIVVIGLVSDLRTYDSGSERLILADPIGGGTVQVISLPGRKQQPSSYAHIGDELKVGGEVSNSAKSTVIYSRSDGIECLRPARNIMTVDLLANNWRLFEWDELQIRGIVRTDATGSGLRLFSPDAQFSIGLIGNCTELIELLGREVVLQCTLFFDREVMCLVLRVQCPC